MDDNNGDKIGKNVAFELLKPKCEAQFSSFASIMNEISIARERLKWFEEIESPENKRRMTINLLNSLEKGLRASTEDDDAGVNTADYADSVHGIKDRVERGLEKNTGASVNLMARDELEKLYFNGVVPNMIYKFAECQCDKKLYMEVEYTEAEP